ncbi:MAG: N-6 DNA methylase, partial [Ekhidna sp.]
FLRGVPPKSKGDYAFILHMIDTALPTGKVGVIVSHGVLFRGSAEGKIRQKLIEENLLEAVIGLPTNLFFGTGIPAAILIFNKAKKHQDVLFIDASKEYQEGKKQNKFRNEDIARIAATYQSFETVEKYAYRAKLEEINENDFNLNIPRYVDTFEEEEPIDIPKVQEEIKQLEAELIEVRKEMDGYLKELGF